MVSPIYHCPVQDINGQSNISLPSTRSHFPVKDLTGQSKISLPSTRSHWPVQDLTSQSKISLASPRDVHRTAPGFKTTNRRVIREETAD
nr:Biomphalaria glabrata carbohydrate sulfotransferase 3-like; transcript variant X2; misc_RNA [Biomphalaria glabrata]